MDNKPIFSENDLGNRFLWLGYLLSQLDSTYKNTMQIFLKPNDDHKDEVAEIIEWQNQLVIAMSSSHCRSRLLGMFFRKHNLESLGGEQIRIIAVVSFRQTLMHYRDTPGMHIARVASLTRTIDDVLRHRNVVAKLFATGLLLQETDVQHNFLSLHQGLGDFLLGNAAAPVDKPEPKQPQPPVPAPEKPRPEPEKPKVNPVSLPDFVKSLPEMSPREMAKVIHREGYIGQDKAVKSICLMAWRHLNRLKKVFVEKIDYKELPPKGNALMLGSSGCGKTYLVELLFFKIINLPVVIVDASNFVETGYVGTHIPSIFTRLIQVANRDVEKAGLGIICFDEFDKICSSHSAARFAGQGTTKDLKLGVQQELLKVMEGSEVTCDLDLKSSHDKQVIISTKNIPMICCGAFSGLKSMLQKQGKAIGFGAKDGKNSQMDFKDEIKRASSFESYGIIPELYGRFSSLVCFDDLNEDELKAILKRNTIQQYEKELSLNGLGLQVYPDVYDHIVEQCLERQTGARGLQTALISHLEEALFEAYSNPNSQSIRLFVDGGRIGWEVTKRHTKRARQEESKKEMLVEI